MSELSEKKKRPRANQAVAISAVTAVMTAFVFIVTFFQPLQIRFPATGGYFNFGDIMIFTSAFTFGPIVGGFAGGVGSSFADVGSGSANFAPFTLVIKGLEGLVAGYVAQKRIRGREYIGWFLGGTILVVGYFLVVAFLYGLPSALFPELPGDVIQAVSGGLVGLPVSRALRARLPPLLKGGLMKASSNSTERVP
jgi:uncharacterized membrane protein